MAILANLILWGLAELALLFTALVSPDIGPGDIYQTIDLIHGFSLFCAVAVFLANLTLLLRVARPRKTQLMLRVNGAGLLLASLCFWAITQALPTHP